VIARKKLDEPASDVFPSPIDNAYDRVEDSELYNCACGFLVLQCYNGRVTNWVYRNLFCL